MALVGAYLVGPRNGRFSGERGYLVASSPVLFFFVLESDLT